MKKVHKHLEYPLKFNTIRTGLINLMRNSRPYFVTLLLRYLRQVERDLPLICLGAGQERRWRRRQMAACSVVGC